MRKPSNGLPIWCETEFLMQASLGRCQAMVCVLTFVVLLMRWNHPSSDVATQPTNLNSYVLLLCRFLHCCVCCHCYYCLARHAGLRMGAKLLYFSYVRLTVVPCKNPLPE